MKRMGLILGATVSLALLSACASNDYYSGRYGYSGQDGYGYGQFYGGNYPTYQYDRGRHDRDYRSYSGRRYYERR
jgi:hypothetical protein